MQRFLTIWSRVFFRADTGVTSLSCIVTGAAVFAWPVIGAIVQILIAEQSAPALLAYAVPWFGACSVHAARMSLALVAQLAHPARMTTEIKQRTVSKVYDVITSD